MPIKKNPINPPIKYLPVSLSGKSKEAIDLDLKTIIKPTVIIIIAKNLLKVSPSISIAILAPIIAPNVATIPKVTDENQLQNQEMEGSLAQALNDLDTENYHRERNGLEPLSPEDAGIDLPEPSDFLPEHSDPNGNPPSTDVELTEKQIKQLQNALDKQRKFNDGNPTKTGKLSKKDSAMVQTMEDDMGQVILDYLRVESEEDLTPENIDELLEVRKFLEMPSSEGGKGFTFDNSPHFEILYHSIQMLADEILDEVEGVSQETKIDNINEQPNQTSEISLDDESMWDELLEEMEKEDKEKKD